MTLIGIEEVIARAEDPGFQKHHGQVFYQVFCLALQQIVTRDFSAKGGGAAHWFLLCEASGGLNSNPFALLVVNKCLVAKFSIKIAKNTLTIKTCDLSKWRRKNLFH